MVSPAQESTSGFKAHPVTPLALRQRPTTRARPHPFDKTVPPPVLTPPLRSSPSSSGGETPSFSPASGSPLARGSSFPPTSCKASLAAAGTRCAPGASRGLKKQRGEQGESGEKWGSGGAAPAERTPCPGARAASGSVPRPQGAGGAAVCSRGRAGEGVALSRSGSGWPPRPRSAAVPESPGPCPCHGRAARGSGGAPGPRLGQARAPEGAPGEADPGGGQSSG